MIKRLFNWWHRITISADLRISVGCSMIKPDRKWRRKLYIACIACLCDGKLLLPRLYPSANLPLSTSNPDPQVKERSSKLDCFQQVSFITETSRKLVWYTVLVVISRGKAGFNFDKRVDSRYPCCKYHNWCKYLHWTFFQTRTKSRVRWIYRQWLVPTGH